MSLLPSEGVSVLDDFLSLDWAKGYADEWCEDFHFTLLCFKRQWNTGLAL
jgi:hypothetical protein